MRLVTYEREGSPRLGIIFDGAVYDVQGADASLPGDMLSLIEGGPDAWDAVVRVAERASGLSPVTGARLLAPIPRPRKNVVCVGLNYSDHAGETKMELPKYPVFFTKAPTCVIGPETPVSWHGGVSDKIDWEAELAVVIGKRGRDIPEDRALEHVFGYTAGNDVTARDLQRNHQQWFKGKSLDGFCPMGPWIVTADEIPDPQSLAVRCRVNGVTKQDSDTSKMIFPVARLISVLSSGMTLEPGDLLMTGTPSGVGFARTPAEYLRPGDVVEVEVEGIGALRNPVASA